MFAGRYILVSEGNAVADAGRDWMQEEMWRRMLRLKTSGEARTTGARRTGNRAVTGILAAGLLMAGAAQGQAQGTVASPTTQTIPIASSKIGPAAPVTYANRYEVFGALNLQNFQAGQNLPKRMNLGGFEVLGTYWLTKKIGLAADYRIDAGTTPVFANAFVNNRPLVYLNTGMLGAQYRGPKNQYAALNFHAYGGVSHGTFTYSTKDVPPLYLPTIGLYTNRTKPIAALGGSIDFNVRKNWAIRFSPDLILEHFGTETREFFGLSGGVVYRIGKK
jgi:hypothetical protein